MMKSVTTVAFAMFVGSAVLFTYGSVMAAPKVKAENVGSFCETRCYQRQQVRGTAVRGIGRCISKCIGKRSGN